MDEAIKMRKEEAKQLGDTIMKENSFQYMEDLLTYLKYRKSLFSQIVDFDWLITYFILGKFIYENDKLIFSSDDEKFKNQEIKLWDKNVTAGLTTYCVDEDSDDKPLVFTGRVVSVII